MIVTNMKTETVDASESVSNNSKFLYNEKETL